METKINRIISSTAAIVLSSLLFLQCSTSRGPVLSDLSIGFYKTDLEYVPCKLNESFSPDTFIYSAAVEKSYTANMIVIASLAEGQDEIKVDIPGSEALAPDTFKIALQTGKNPFEIILTNKKGKTVTYSLVIDQQDWSTVYYSEKIADGIWRIQDFGGFGGNEDMYLFEGDGKALLFDAGMGTGDLAGYIRNLTTLPIEIAITHPHRDHFGQINQFKESTVNISKNDIDRLPPDFVTPKFRYVKDGDVIDIGKGRRFEVIEVTGHSAGGLLFLDRANKYLVVGDAIGSGDRVHLFGAGRAPLSEYVDDLKKTEEILKDLDGVTLLVGHHYQEKTPLTGAAGKQLITDMRILTEKVISGEITGKKAIQIRNGDTTELRQSYYGLAGLWHNPQF